MKLRTGRNLLLGLLLVGALGFARPDDRDDSRRFEIREEEVHIQSGKNTVKKAKKEKKLQSENVRNNDIFVSHNFSTEHGSNR